MVFFRLMGSSATPVWRGSEQRVYEWRHAGGIREDQQQAEQQKHRRHGNQPPQPPSPHKGQDFSNHIRIGGHPTEEVHQWS